MPKLFIGPWVGEFGVELMRWQARARAVAAESQWDEVVVATRQAHFFLYEDFADRLVAFEPSTIHTGGRGCWDHHFHGLGQSFAPGPEDRHMTPFVTGEQWQEHELQARHHSKFINYAKRSSIRKTAESCDILIHARASEKSNQQFKNWPLRAWEAFMEQFASQFKIGSIGSAEGAYHIPRTVDLRGIPLADLSGHLGMSKLLVGPSSGPMHLAMLCETPLVTWCEHTGCHQSHWNPFQVPLCLLPGWAPRPEVVSAKVREMLRLTSAKPCRRIIACPSGTDYQAFVDWIRRTDHSVNHVVMPDCITDAFQSHPRFRLATPTSQLSPKYLNEPNLKQQVQGGTRSNDPAVLLPVVFDLPMDRWSEILVKHPGAQGIVLLEDLGTTLMRLKTEWRGYYDVPLPDDVFKRVAASYKKLLEAALGKRDPNTGGIAFVSLNRLRKEADYRREIARSIHCGDMDNDLPWPESDVSAELGAKLIGGRFRSFVTQRKLEELERQFHHFESQAKAAARKNHGDLATRRSG